jgi:hypothetical protein
MMTFAVPESVELPVTANVLEAVIVVAATAPVTAPTKPFVEVTGPENVVEAMINSLYMQYFVL